MNATGGDLQGLFLSNVFINNPATNNVLSYQAGNWTNTDFNAIFGTGYTTNSNTAWGLSTPLFNVGTNNVWLGYSAGSGQTGSSNTVVGSASSAGSTSSNSVIVGAGSTSTGGGTVNIIGQGNNVGASADSTFIGTAIQTASGSQNQVIIGDRAGSVNNNGQFDVIMGWQCGTTLTEAKVGGQGQNVLIGALTEDVNSGFTSPSTLGGCVVVGSQSGINGTGRLSTNILGAFTTSSASNQLLLGNGCNGGTFAGAIVLGNACNAKEANTLHLGGSSPGNLLTTTTAAAGAASALPAKPQGYLVVYLNNSASRFKIPFYNN